MNKESMAMTLMERVSELPENFNPVGNPQHREMLDHIREVAKGVQGSTFEADDAQKAEFLKVLFKSANAFTIDGPFLISRSGRNPVTQILVTEEGVRFSWMEGSISYEPFFPTDELKAAVFAGNEWTIVDEKGNPHRFGFFSLYRIQSGSEDPLISEGAGTYLMTGSECSLAVKNAVLRVVARDNDVMIACSVNSGSDKSDDHHVGSLTMSLPTAKSLG